MLEALVISTVVLWIAVVVLAAVVFALARQVGVLHERVTPAGALVGREEPRVGEPAPRLSLLDWSGQPLEIGAPSADGRATLVLFVSPTCPVCKTVLPIAESVLRADGGRTRLVVASDGPRAEHEAFVHAHALAGRPYVLSAALGHAYQVGKLPYAALIDAGGILRGRGLVNTREHLESLFEAMRLRVATIQEHLKVEGAAPSAPFESLPVVEHGGAPPSIRTNGGVA